MNIRHFLISAALMAAFVPLAGAQTAAPTVQRQERISQHEPMAQHEPMMQQQPRPFSLPSERIEARLAYLRTALKITPAQETQWNAYAEVARRHARAQDERAKSWQADMHERMHGPQPSAVERLERMQSFHADAVVRLNETLAALKPLYAALSPQQKAIADEILSPHRMGSRGFSGRAGPMGPR